MAIASQNKVLHKTVITKSFITGPKQKVQLGLKFQSAQIVYEMQIASPDLETLMKPNIRLERNI